MLANADVAIWAYGADRTISNYYIFNPGAATTTITLGARRDLAGNIDPLLLAGPNDPYDLTFTGNSFINTAQTTTIVVPDSNTLVALTGSIGEFNALSAAGAGFIKTGYGELALAGNNTYTGVATINVGTVRAQSNTALGASRNTEMRLLVQTNGATGSYGLTFVSSAVLGLAAVTDSTLATAFTSATTAAQLQTALNNLASIGGIGGSVTVTLTTETLGASTFNVFNIVFGGALAGLSAGALTVQAGTYLPAVAAPTVIIPGSTATGVTVAAGAGLLLDGSLSIDNKPLTLTSGSVQGSGYVGSTGAGFAGAGSLRALNGNSTWGNGQTQMRLTGTGFNVTVGANSATDSLSLNGQVAQNAANVSGLNKVGLGVVALGGTVANTYAGSTIVNDGTLALSKSSGLNAFGGTLIVGDNLGAGTDTLRLDAGEVIPDATTPTINSTGAIVASALQATSATNETQQIVFGGTATAGTYTVSGGPITGTLTLPFNATGPQLQAALNAAGVLPGGTFARVTTTGTTPNFTHQITFVGLASDPNLVTVNITGLTGGTPTMAPSTISNYLATGRETFGATTIMIGTSQSGSIDMTAGGGASRLLLGGDVSAIRTCWKRARR